MRPSARQLVGALIVTYGLAAWGLGWLSAANGDAVWVFSLALLVVVGFRLATRLT